jgi:hypothetical protein
MKTNLLAVLLLLTCSTLFGQGFIWFQNTTSPETRISTNDGIGGVGFVDGTAQWVIGLYLAPYGTTDIGTFDTLPSSWQLVVTSTNRTGAFRGLFTAYQPLALPPQYSVGTTYATMVRAWQNNPDGRLGSHWAGAAGPGYITPVSAGGPYPNVFGASAGQIGAFTLARYPELPQTPEPSTFALFTIGSLIAAAFFGKPRRNS